MAGGDIIKHTFRKTLRPEGSLPGWITQQTLDKALRVKDLIAQGLSRKEVAQALGVTDSQMSRVRRQVAPGQSQWPWVITDEFLSLPVKELQRDNARCRGAEQRRVEKRAISNEDILARIDADQARQRADREKWLDIEREKYSLPRRGRLIDGMPA